MTKRVLVIGGSEEYPGAVYLAGISALRSGAESVLVMTPKNVAWSINSLSPDLMTIKLQGDHLAEEHMEVIDLKLQNADILLVGNGAGQAPETLALMKRLISWSGPKVIDADAIYAIENNEVVQALITPNQNEWNALEKNNDIKRLLEGGNIIIQKGDPTHILSPHADDEVQVHSELHKAGMGDVLAGLSAGALARGRSLSEAAREACERGNVLAAALSDGNTENDLLASDIVKGLTLGH